MKRESNLNRTAEKAKVKMFWQSRIDHARFNHSAYFILLRQVATPPQKSSCLMQVNVPLSLANKTPLMLPAAAKRGTWRGSLPHLSLLPRRSRLALRRANLPLSLVASSSHMNPPPLRTLQKDYALGLMRLVRLGGGRFRMSEVSLYIDP